MHQYLASDAADAGVVGLAKPPPMDDTELCAVAAVAVDNMLSRPELLDATDDIDDRTWCDGIKGWFGMP